MMRILLALALAAGLGGVVSQAAVMQGFGVGYEAIWSRLDERGPLEAAVIGVPLVLLFLRGWIGF